MVNNRRPTVHQPRQPGGIHVLYRRGGRSLFFGLVLFFATSCGRGATPQPEAPPDQPASEPSKYSALLTRKTSDGLAESTVEMRIVKNGELLRQEWIQDGEKRAMIWRPDLGKAFMLSLDKTIYSETAIGSASTAPSDAGQIVASENEPLLVDADGIDRAISTVPEPDSIEVVPQPNQTVGGYECAVIEQRMKFADGHIEMTRTYRAAELGGLAVRVESEGAGEKGSAKVITELHNVTLSAPDSEFQVPEQFKKVDRLQ